MRGSEMAPFVFFAKRLFGHRHEKEREEKRDKQTERREREEREKGKRECETNKKKTVKRRMGFHGGLEIITFD